MIEGSILKIKAQEPENKRISSRNKNLYGTEIIDFLR